jgi:hypothetical protein|tara:strand:+ start:555 stop:818 length:264 start_codon:yes stop_codon:yes gene_type:complete
MIKIIKLDSGGPIIIGDVKSEKDRQIKMDNPAVVFQETDDNGTNKFKIGTFMELADRNSFYFYDFTFKCIPSEQLTNTYNDFISQTK